MTTATQELQLAVNWYYNVNARIGSLYADVVGKPLYKTTSDFVYTDYPGLYLFVRLIESLLLPHEPRVVEFHYRHHQSNTDILLIADAISPLP